MKVPGQRFRFNLRTVLVSVVFIALAVGWYASAKRERARNLMLSQQLLNAHSQVQLTESRAMGAKMRRDGFSHDPSRRQRWADARNEKIDFCDTVIQGGESAFQRADFVNFDFTNASLTGGGASFQHASFENAILKNAKLMGGGSSFQLASFVGADLSGATLTGNLQGLSLQRAKCFGTTIEGSFQGSDIDSAEFQGANLSAIRSEDLHSCYFRIAPTYDANTKFPEAFDPAAAGWNKTNIWRATDE
jgi:uncharacterized protein YjbI with pentapeptide repeats